MPLFHLKRSLEVFGVDSSTLSIAFGSHNYDIAVPTLAGDFSKDFTNIFMSSIKSDGPIKSFDEIKFKSCAARISPRE
ncbi:MAG: hypothetical protein KA715_13070 [Xanthomonadaceae bacterium]|nr:hypothetical protein [Xanthomonadaceae bacterium]